LRKGCFPTPIAIRSSFVTSRLTIVPAQSDSATFTRGIAGGGGGILVKPTNNQAAIDLWNDSPSGATPAGGAKWRIFSDNVGGGGGACTFSYYDLANGRLAMGLDNNGGLIIPYPEHASLGSGWISWSPSFSAGGSMTLSSIAINYAKYIRIGPLVYFRIYFGCTFGGAISSTFNISLPFISASDGGHTMVTGAYFQGAGWVPSSALVLDNDNHVSFNTPPGGALVGGGAFVSVSGFYSCA
jgi:hypothetical protein